MWPKNMTLNREDIVMCLFQAQSFYTTCYPLKMYKHNVTVLWDSFFSELGDFYIKLREEMLLFYRRLRKSPQNLLKTSFSCFVESRHYADAQLSLDSKVDSKYEPSGFPPFWLLTVELGSPVPFFPLLIELEKLNVFPTLCANTNKSAHISLL